MTIPPSEHDAVSPSKGKPPVGRECALEEVVADGVDLQRIIDAVNIGLLLIDQTGSVRRINEAASRWLAAGVSSVSGDQPGNLVGCIHVLEDPAGCGHAPNCASCSVRRTFETVLRTGLAVHSVEAETTLLRDGREIRLWIEVGADPLVLDGRRYAIVSLNDITTRKRAEEILLKAHDELEARVLERTAALSESESTRRYLSTQLLVAQEEERRHVAQDIHDSLGSSLAALKFRLEMIARIRGRGAAQSMARSLEEAAGLLQQNIEEVRRIQLALRPPLLDDLGILATLRWLCREFEKTWPLIKVETVLAQDEALIPPILKPVMFRLCQEAINNIAKHSRADHVRISLASQVGSLELAILDNGRGFDREAVLSRKSGKGGLGLLSMRERVLLSGGKFDIETRHGAGTRILAVWPLNPETDAPRNTDLPASSDGQ